MMYRGELVDIDFSPGEESLETRLFEEHEIPWDEMAFPVISVTLELFFKDRQQGDFRIHTGDMIRTSEPPYAFQLNTLD